jgi:hypothetical protein
MMDGHSAFMYSSPCGVPCFQLLALYVFQLGNLDVFRNLCALCTYDLTLTVFTGVWPYLGGSSKSTRDNRKV